MGMNLDVYYDKQLLASYLINTNLELSRTPTVSIDLTETIDLLIRDGSVQRTIHRHHALAVHHNAQPLDRTVKQKPKPETTA